MELFVLRELQVAMIRPDASASEHLATALPDVLQLATGVLNVEGVR